MVRSPAGHLLVRIAVLCGSMGAALALVLPGAYRYRGWSGCAAAGLAACTCLAAGLLSVGVRASLPGPDLMMRQALCGMFLRLGLPLVVCLTAYLYGGVLAEVGFVYYIITFYFVTWAVEIMWLVRSAPRDPRSGSEVG